MSADYHGFMSTDPFIVAPLGRSTFPIGTMQNFGSKILL
jgi:hypothetical protein